MLIRIPKKSSILDAKKPRGDWYEMEMRIARVQTYYEKPPKPPHFLQIQ